MTPKALVIKSEVTIHNEIIVSKEVEDLEYIIQCSSDKGASWEDIYSRGDKAPILLLYPSVVSARPEFLWRKIERKKTLITSETLL